MATACQAPAPAQQAAACADVSAGEAQRAEQLHDSPSSLTTGTHAPCAVISCTLRTQSTAQEGTTRP